jgi:hypothetical protein
MNDNTMLLGVLIACIVMLVMGYLIFLQRKSAQKDNDTKKASAQLQLQAYERLILLTERIALTNIINRVNSNDFMVRDMQRAATMTIKEEFDYNITQQIYVSADAWTAVRNLKEQNILAINELANTLPANATGLDLSKAVLEYLMKHPLGNLHTMVSDFLSAEAKKLL